MFAIFSDHLVLVSLKVIDRIARTKNFIFERKMKFLYDYIGPIFFAWVGREFDSALANGFLVSFCHVKFRKCIFS